MTFVPAAAAAIVPASKVRDYILDADHPENGGKAELFGRFGFAPDAWPLLADALRRHPVDNSIARRVTTPLGVKYVVQCHLRTPDGRDPCRTSVWMIDHGATVPRLVTAY